MIHATMKMHVKKRMRMERRMIVAVSQDFPKTVIWSPNMNFDGDETVDVDVEMVLDSDTVVVVDVVV
jgi:hypothetical protein